MLLGSEVSMVLSRLLSDLEVVSENKSKRYNYKIDDKSLA
jgi:hypothetical protein